MSKGGYPWTDDTPSIKPLLETVAAPWHLRSTSWISGTDKERPKSPSQAHQSRQAGGSNRRT
jgi:hypothetical protein